MADLRERADYYLARLEHRDDDAARSLGYVGAAALPFVVEAFRRETRLHRRAALVRIAWQYRTDEAIPLLTTALHDPEPDVWKEAFDGFVSLGTPAALAALRAARAEASRGSDVRVLLEWIDEAIRQIEHGCYG